MSKRLCLLLVEDNEDDELLVLRELRRAGYDVTHRRVQTAEDMREALAGENWDIVISDYSMPRFSALGALEVLHRSGMDLPFIITSGTIDEETAVQALRAGAHDFMLKSNLARLAPAIEREMKDAETRRGHRMAEEEVRRLEGQVRHSQKMEAVGRLAGGVAHDFNNILTAILATADLALAASELEDSLRADLESIRESGMRAAAITRQLLAFSRKQVVQPQAVDINDIVNGLAPMLNRLLPPGVTLSVDTRAEGIIEADPTQVEQVLLNLVVNAGDAMPGGGKVTVSTGDLTVHSASANGRKMLLPGSYVVLRVQDEGIGMDEETKARIFEPFFTTKEPGRGTGLGLATVYGIVEQAHGHIIVHSQPGQGATFEVCLPAIEARAQEVLETNPTSGDLRGSEVVLIVEDEASVRAPISRTLRQLGYFVLEARNGEDALAVLQEHHAPVHLVISDVIMPEMNGAELVSLLHAWYPNLMVLFISGYSDTVLKEHGALAEDIAYMAKPFTPEDLARRVRQLLDHGHHRRPSRAAAS